MSTDTDALQLHQNALYISFLLCAKTASARTKDRLQYNSRFIPKKNMTKRDEISTSKGKEKQGTHEFLKYPTLTEPTIFCTISHKTTEPVMLNDLSEMQSPKTYKSFTWLILVLQLQFLIVPNSFRFFIFCLFFFLKSASENKLKSKSYLKEHTFISSIHFPKNESASREPKCSAASYRLFSFLVQKKLTLTFQLTWLSSPLIPKRRKLELISAPKSKTQKPLKSQTKSNSTNKTNLTKSK